jgi:hypothetical protein
MRSIGSPGGKACFFEKRLKASRGLSVVPGKEIGPGGEIAQLPEVLSWGANA